MDTQVPSHKGVYKATIILSGIVIFLLSKEMVILTDILPYFCPLRVMKLSVFHLAVSRVNKISSIPSLNQVQTTSSLSTLLDFYFLEMSTLNSEAYRPHNHHMLFTLQPALASVQVEGLVSGRQALQEVSQTPELKGPSLLRVPVMDCGSPSLGHRS